MDQSTTHLELALQAAVRRCMDDVVRQANADAMLLKGARMEKNQIRNVLNVADESRSLAVVTNFIRYQLGRSQTGPAWRHNGFGLRVIEQIEARQGIVARQMERVLKQARERVGDISAEKADEVRYDLTRHYLGYLHRAFYYGNETGNWDNLRVPE
jgi:hypothetical protein